MLQKLFINKYINYTERYQKDQETIKFFEKLYSKSLQDIVIDKNENESLRNNFTKYVE